VTDVSRWTWPLTSDPSERLGETPQRPAAGVTPDRDERAPEAPNAIGADAAAERAASARSREDRLRSLFDAYYDFVWRVLRRLLREPAEVDDAAQEVFAIVLSKLDQIDDGCERSFLYGTALRVAKNVGRRRANAPLGEPSAEDEAPAKELLPDAALELARQRRLLDAVFAQLPEHLVRILILAEIEELPASEIAQLEQIPPGTVASRLRKGRELVRRHVNRRLHERRGGDR
jgi:RNA polymerase sigma-70 factor (ECF subfamily)